MRVVTSVSLFKVAAGQKMSITYSDINEEGDIVKDNVKTSKIILDEEVIEKINTVLQEPQTIVESIE